MELWIPITIAAAFLQNLRSALQKHIKGRLSTLGAAYSRFVSAWPLALAYMLGLNGIGGLSFPEPNGLYLIYCLLGAMTQILFTVVLLWMFSFRSFAVGTTFSKLEVVIIAVLGALILGDGVGAVAALVIPLSAVGVVCLSMDQANLTLRGLASGLADRPTLIGLLCAGLLGASVVFFRGAALALGGASRHRRGAVLGLLVHRLHPAERRLCARGGPDRAGVHLPRLSGVLPREGEPAGDQRYPAGRGRDPAPAAGGVGGGGGARPARWNMFRLPGSVSGETDLLDEACLVEQHLQLHVVEDAHVIQEQELRFRDRPVKEILVGRAGSHV